MFAGSTLLLDVGTQCDLWPGGAWPLLDAAAAAQARTLCALGARLGVRAGGVCCAHETMTHAGPPHCRAGSAGAARVASCDPSRPPRLVEPGAAPPCDREAALYLTSGCDRAIGDVPEMTRAFDHLTAGIRSAVVFGAGIELGIAHVVTALLARRVPTHLVLDASGAVDPAASQRLIGGWKRAGVDVLTTATVVRLLDPRGN